MNVHHKWFLLAGAAIAGVVVSVLNHKAILKANSRQLNEALREWQDSHAQRGFPSTPMLSVVSSLEGGSDLVEKLAELTVMEEDLLAKVQEDTSQEYSLALENVAKAKQSIAEAIAIMYTDHLESQVKAA